MRPTSLNPLVSNRLMISPTRARFTPDNKRIKKVHSGVSGGCGVCLVCCAVRFVLCGLRVRVLTIRLDCDEASLGLCAEHTRDRGLRLTSQGKRSRRKRSAARMRIPPRVARAPLVLSSCDRAHGSTTAPANNRSHRSSLLSPSHGRSCLRHQPAAPGSPAACCCHCPPRVLCMMRACCCVLHVQPCLKRLRGGGTECTTATADA